RYRMLETIRQFAQERLSESGAGAGVRQRHLEFHARFTDEVDAHIQGPDQAEWLRRVDAELDNILAAHAWSDRADNGAELDLRLVAGWRLYWFARGLFNLGLRTTSEALARDRGGPPTQSRARALLAGGFVALRMAELDTARRLLEEGIPIARALGENSITSRALCFLGIVLLSAGDGPA